MPCLPSYPPIPLAVEVDGRIVRGRVVVLRINDIIVEHAETGERLGGHIMAQALGAVRYCDHTGQLTEFGYERAIGKLLELDARRGG